MLPYSAHLRTHNSDHRHSVLLRSGSQRGSSRNPQEMTASRHDIPSPVSTSRRISSSTPTRQLNFSSNLSPTAAPLFHSHHTQSHHRLLGLPSFRSPQNRRVCTPGTRRLVSLPTKKKDVVHIRNERRTRRKRSPQHKRPSSECQSLPYVVNGSGCATADCCGDKIRLGSHHSYSSSSYTARGSRGGGGNGGVALFPSISASRFQRQCQQRNRNRIRNRDRDQRRLPKLPPRFDMIGVGSDSLDFTPPKTDIRTPPVAVPLTTFVPPIASPTTTSKNSTNRNRNRSRNRGHRSSSRPYRRPRSLRTHTKAQSRSRARARNQAPTSRNRNRTRVIQLPNSSSPYRRRQSSVMMLPREFPLQASIHSVPILRAKIRKRQQMKELASNPLTLRKRWNGKTATGTGTGTRTGRGISMRASSFSGGERRNRNRSIGSNRKRSDQGVRNRESSASGSASCWSPWTPQSPETPRHRAESSSMSVPGRGRWGHVRSKDRQRASFPSREAQRLTEEYRSRRRRQPTERLRKKKIRAEFNLDLSEVQGVQLKVLRARIRRKRRGPLKRGKKRPSSDAFRSGPDDDDGNLADGEEEPESESDGADSPEEEGGLEVDFVGETDFSVAGVAETEAEEYVVPGFEFSESDFGGSAPWIFPYDRSVVLLEREEYSESINMSVDSDEFSDDLMRRFENGQGLDCLSPREETEQ